MAFRNSLHATEQSSSAPMTLSLREKRESQACPSS